MLFRRNSYLFPLAFLGLAWSAPLAGQRGPINPPTLPTHTAPLVSAAPHNDVFVSAARGTATAAYQTPSYVSIDQERSLGLMYASGMARPRALIQVDARTTEAQSRLSLRVRDRAGVWQTFMDGSQELFFNATTVTHSRLAGQIDVSGLPTGAYEYDVVVRGYWADGTSTAASPLRIRVLVVNGRDSPYGIGWSVAGLQHLVPSTAGVLIYEGDGSASWFAYPGTCVQGVYPQQYCGYKSPDGDFSYLARDVRTGGYLRAYPSGVRVEYSATGRMTKLQDAGNITHYAYDAAGRLTSVTDPAGLAITLGYDAAGKLAWIQDHSGRRVTTRVQSTGVLDLICDPLGCPFRAGYDDNQRMSWQMALGGARWDYDYHTSGTVEAVLSPAVDVDGRGSIRPVTAFRSLEAAVLPPAGSGTAASPAPHLPPSEVVLSVKDANANETRIRVDRFGSPVRIEEPLGRVTTFERDQHGRPSRVTAFNGDVTEYTYIGSRISTVRDVANNRTTTYEWQEYITGHQAYPAGTRHYDYPLRISTPGEPAARYERSTSQPYLVQDGPTRYYHRAFDGFGRPSESFGPGTHSLTFYASRGAGNTDSVMTVSGSDTLTTRFVRDTLGRVIRTVNSRGVATTAQYDALNRVQSATGPGGTTAYAYAPAGWLQMVTDPKGQQYVYTRNALGWLVSEQDPRGGVFSSTYDPAGQLVSATNRRRQTVRYAHDALGRMVRRTSHEGAVTTYASDPAGRWMSVQNAEASDTIRAVRGPASAVDQVTVRGGLPYTLNTRLDTIGNLTHIAGSWGYGVTHYRMNDGTRRIREVRDHRVGLSTHISRDEALNRTLRVLPSGDTIIQGALETRYTDPSAGSALNRSYVYTTERWVNRRSKSGSYVDVFQYDPHGQVQFESRFAAGPDPRPLSNRTYTYDGVGNPTHRGASVSTGNRLDVYDGFTLTYDADGNLIRKYKPGAGIDWSYEWNSLGQLVKAEGTSDGSASGWRVITFGYDGSGRRVRKTAGGVTTRYIYDGQHVVAETDGAGTVVREFTYYEGVDNPHSMRVGGQTYYYVRDHQGNVTGVVNAAGTLVNRYEYTSFGAGSVVVEGVANPLRYAGGWYDQEIGLYFNRARYYDPALERFVSEDPLGLAAGVNPYAYAGNNPVNLSDPTGFSPCPTWGEVMGPDGKCRPKIVFVIPGLVVGGGQPLDRDWWKDMYEREYQVPIDVEHAYADDMQARYEAELDERRINDAVHSLREASDLGVGFLPGVSTVHDGTVVFTGYNVVTGEKVGLGGRSIAFVGMVTPVSGGQLRAATRFIGPVVIKNLKQVVVATGTVDLGPTLKRIADGIRHPHPRDGTTFRNKEGRLPAGSYTEYVVPTPGLSPGPQRLVIGADGSIHYTPDHYHTFVPVNP